MQQRGIPLLAIELLCQYGKEEYANDAMIRYFDKKGLKKARREIQKMMLDQLDKMSEMYCVETNEGTILTVGHRFRPIKRNLRHRPPLS
jgi:hypothetical protein